jgi:superfamily II DNA or RNA helicase
MQSHEGSAVMAWTPRRHQQAADTLAQAIQAGSSDIQRIWHLVTPGGGKSLLPVIYASRLIPDIVDRICWLVPRDSLRTQAAEAFCDEDARRYWNHRLAIREVEGFERDPARGTAGYVTTYQSVTQYSLLHRDEFLRARYALILDEPHHLNVGGPWANAIRSLIEASALTMFMTGTLERHDGEPVLGMEYVQDEHGHRVPNLEHPHYRVIHYRRADALDEGQIIEIDHAHTGFESEWISRDGERRNISDSSELRQDERQDAVHLSLEPDYAFDLLRLAINDWSETLKRHPHNQLLVVAHRQSRAQEYAEFLRRARIKTGVAISEYGAAAHRAIQAFRRRQTSALVTVGMAYEGMDAKGISHLVALTHIRSRSWIEQMIARASRVDPLRSDEQTAMIYTPRDPLMMDVLERIKAEQAARLRNTRSSGDGRIAAETPNPDPRDIVIFSSRAVNLLYRELYHLPMTPAQKEAKLRDFISRRTLRIDKVRGWEFGTTNKMILREFGVPREDMTLEEMARVWAWLNRHHGDV